MIAPIYDPPSATEFLGCNDPPCVERELPAPPKAFIGYLSPSVVGTIKTNLERGLKFLAVALRSAELKGDAFAARQFAWGIERTEEALKDIQSGETK